MFYIFIVALVNFTCISFAFDSSPLQDFCVADPTSSARCKGPQNRRTQRLLPHGAKFAWEHIEPVRRLGHNGLLGHRAGAQRPRPHAHACGPSAARVLSPHFHTRATELVTVLEGSIEIGFITSYPHYKYFSKILNVGDVFVVPVGFVHNVRNLGRGNSVVMVAFNSENPSVVNIPNAVFAAELAVDSGYLAAAAFRLDRRTVEELQRKF